MLHLYVLLIWEHLLSVPEKLVDCSHRSRDRLSDLVAEHLDHLHYLNDILCIGLDTLNLVLIHHLLNNLFIPLYVYSLTKRKKFDDPQVCVFCFNVLLSALIDSFTPLIMLCAYWSECHVGGFLSVVKYLKYIYQSIFCIFVFHSKDKVDTFMHMKN